MKKRNVITVIALIAFILILVVAKYISKRLSVIPENDPALIGNTAGNLYNGGFFCESDDKVYFSNAYDNYALYSMNADQTEVKKLASGITSYINAGGNYVYYYSRSSSDQSGLGYVRNGRGIYRVDKKGKNNILLGKLSTDSMLLVGNYVLYTDFQEDEKSDNALVSVKGLSTDGSFNFTYFSGHPRLASSQSGSVYYAAMEGDHFLHCLDPLTGSFTAVCEANMYEPIVQGDQVYFLDLDNNYHLSVCPLSGGEVRELIPERMDSYNLYGDMVYYQTVDEKNPEGYALKRARIDGTSIETVKTGVYTDLSVTSSYVYFREFNNDVPVYCTPTYGSVNVMPFTAAMDAVLK
ncbi:MAG: DUF5050 domain-containing protein [Lachnospiraceae bacterium]|nr:DUF5050 domain-containing protein [Lachnospiraceae bacterium]